MGQFSWLDCKTGEQVLDDVCRDVYLLRPKQFGGGHIVEHCYDGYGRFGGFDVYDLVAVWNREFARRNPDFTSKYGAPIEHAAWYEKYIDLHASCDEVVETARKNSDCKNFEWRYIGIALACYDEDNERLEFPIKITHDPNAVYEDCKPSRSDVNQGWATDDKYDDWDDED